MHAVVPADALSVHPTGTRVVESSHIDSLISSIQEDLGFICWPVQEIIKGRCGLAHNGNEISASSAAGPCASWGILPLFSSNQAS